MSKKIENDLLKILIKIIRTHRDGLPRGDYIQESKHNISLVNGSETHLTEQFSVYATRFGNQTRP